MSVSKIFKILITIVACVIIGAFVLNVLLPNTTQSIVGTLEGQIYNSTGLSFDLNGDNKAGANQNIAQGQTVNSDGTVKQTTTDKEGIKVKGFGQ